jgi:hypothetical protein
MGTRSPSPVSWPGLSKAELARRSGASYNALLHAEAVAVLLKPSPSRGFRRSAAV